ncbi:hypothetical protein GCM10008932_19730 [Alkalibacterium iburiense]|uniref:Na+/H+ antiporter MnhB subunit-related protein domain-containing protein n=1 Tax=Alkalibacterium iburiense TaxID=290589 RepID=A0ABP3HCV5_9LACT
MIKNRRWIKVVDLVLVGIGIGAVLFLYLNYSEQLNTPVKDWIVDNYYRVTGAENGVTAIYLNFRMFDTIFEALMLLVCIMEVINISGSGGKKRQDNVEEIGLGHPKGSDFVIYPMRVVYPLSLFYGIYLILNGHISPGGGFQGGTVLATVFIIRYIIYPKQLINIDQLEKLEFMLFLGIILVPAFSIFMEIPLINQLLPDQVYLIIMNTLIGLKVFAGFSIIINWFIYYEGAEQTESKHEEHT